MSDVINLNRFRKAKKRIAKDQQAIENRAIFGRTKAQKKTDSVTQDKLQQHLDNHQRDDDKVDP